MKFWIWIFGISLAAQTINLEKERALGAGLAGEIRRQSTPFINSEVSAYVERVGLRLVALVPGSEFKFEVVVAEGTEPIGLPGGFVLIPASFLLAAEDEAEFAAMLAHAMGHIVLRHGLLKAPQPQEGAIPLVFMGGWMGVHTDSLQRNALVPAGFLDTMRSNELEADRYGADLAGRAGYDASGLARYFRRVQPEQAARVSGLPVKAVRLAALDHTAGQGGEVGGSEFLRVREVVRVALGAPRRKAPSLQR